MTINEEIAALKRMMRELKEESDRLSIARQYIKAEIEKTLKVIKDLERTLR